MIGSDNKQRARIEDIRRKYSLLVATVKTCIEKYHDPLAFMAQVEAVIQANRNFTFAIQRGKSSIRDFDSWYIPWRNKLEADSCLVWLKDARNNIVHEGLLATASNVELSIIADHKKKVKEEVFDVMESTEEIIGSGVDYAKKDSRLKHAVGVICRHYIFDVNGEEKDVLSVLGAGFAMMSSMYSDLMSYINEEAQSNLGQLELSGILSGLTFDDFKIIFKLRDGCTFGKSEMVLTREDILCNMGGNPLEIKGDKRKRIERQISSENKLTMLHGYFEIAKNNFCKLGSVDAIILCKTKLGSVFAVSGIYRDRSEKMMFMDDLADKVEKNNVTEIVFITEVWVHGNRDKVRANFSEGKEFEMLDGKEERLVAMYVDNKGERITLSAPIIRDATSQNASLGDELVQSNTGEYAIFYPVFRVWGLVDGLKMNNVH